MHRLCMVHLSGNVSAGAGRRRPGRGDAADHKAVLAGIGGLFPPAGGCLCRRGDGSCRAFRPCGRCKEDGQRPGRPNARLGVEGGRAGGGGAHIQRRRGPDHPDPLPASPGAGVAGRVESLREKRPLVHRQQLRPLSTHDRSRRRGRGGKPGAETRAANRGQLRWGELDSLQLHIQAGRCVAGAAVGGPASAETRLADVVRRTQPEPGPVVSALSLQVAAQRGSRFGVAGEGQEPGIRGEAANLRQSVEVVLQLHSELRRRRVVGEDVRWRAFETPA
mmetsp:Transcript_6825/g.16698  ORF Transcript_6825/g.16698 Transcript_6825/m.16698 type:complete len:277 (-) Transcript_6825:153-983(-)